MRAGGMNLILPDVFVAAGGGKILDDAASQADIDELHALADTENGTPLLQEGPQQKELEPVQCGFHGAGALIVGMKKSRIDIASSGQDEAAEGFGRILRQTEGQKAAASVGGPFPLFFCQFIGKRQADGAERGKGIPIILRPGSFPGDQETDSFHGSIPSFSLLKRNRLCCYDMRDCSGRCRSGDLRYPNHKKYGILGSQSGGVGKSAETGKYREKEVGLQRE